VPARRQNTLCHVPAHGYMPAQGHDTAPTSSSLMQPQRVTRKSRQVRCTSNPHVPAAGIAHATLKGPGRYEGGTLTKELPSGHQTRFHCRLTSWILWVRMCEKETDIALLARLPSSMHCLRHGCWFVLVVRAVVHDIWKKARTRSDIYAGTTIPDCPCSCPCPCPGCLPANGAPIFGSQQSPGTRSNGI
jgi:hypothetical protein